MSVSFELAVWSGLSLLPALVFWTRYCVGRWILFFPKDSVEALLVQMMDKVFYHSHFLVSEWNELRGQYLWLGRWSSGIGKSEADGLSTRFLVIKRFIFIDPSQIMLMCFFNNYWIGPLLSFPAFKFWGFIWLFHGFLTLHYLPASSLQVDSTLDPCISHWDKSSWIEPGPLKVLCEVVFLSASGFVGGQESCLAPSQCSRFLRSGGDVKGFLFTQ